MKNLFGFNSFFKFLNRNKGYTFINIAGLSLSLMFVILISIYVKQELSVDAFHEKKDRICLLGNGEGVGSAYRLAYRIQDRYPEIEQVCPVAPGWKKMPIVIADRKYNADLLFVDSTFFDMFSFSLVEGAKETVLQNRDYAVVSESFARKVFPGEDPLGKIILTDDSVKVSISGIMKDIKHSAIPYADILIRIDNIKYFNPFMDSETFDSAGGCTVFIQKKAGSDLDAKAEDMAAFFKDIFWQYRNGHYSRVTFVPLQKFYFQNYFSPGLNHGDKQFVIILLSVGILILIFAIINYINLTAAHSGFRAKEMATRRLLGSSRRELFARLILESTLLTFASFLIALLLAAAAVPVADDLLQTRIYLNESITSGTTLMALGLILLIGALSGMLPASVISNSKPIDVVGGESRRKTKMLFSKVFITFQNVITIVMIAASITMIAQTRHLINAPLKYNSSNLMDIPSIMSKNELFALGNELKHLSSVKRIAYTQGTPLDGGDNNIMRYDEKNKNISFQMITSDRTFFDMLGLEIIRDNHYAGTDGYFLNEQAVKELEISEDAETFTFYGNKPPINGIIKDFQIRNILFRNAPVLYRIVNMDDYYPWNLIVEVQGDRFAAYNEIKAVYEKMTKLEFDGKYFDRHIQDSFEAQRRTSKIVSLFAVVTIVISLLGLVAMSTYFIMQRSREIAVRKVFGSSGALILRWLVITFLHYVWIAFIVAVPIVWYGMSKWLSDYEYRINLSPLIFIGAGLFCLFVSFTAVFVQSYFASRENPVKRLKTE